MLFARLRHHHHLAGHSTLLSFALFAATCLSARIAGAQEITPGTLTSLVRGTEGEASSSTEPVLRELRGKQSVVVLPMGRVRASVLLQVSEAGPGAPPVRYSAIRDDGRRVAQGTCAPGKETTLLFPAGARCALSLDCGAATVALHVRHGYFGLLASREAPARLLTHSHRLYFLVPQSAGSFRVFARAAGEGSAPTLRVLGPDGKPAGTPASAGGGETSVAVKAEPADAGKVWSLTVEAGRGGAEEMEIWLSADIAPFLSEAPQALAVPFIHYTADGALYLGGKEHPALIETTINVAAQPDRLVRAAMMHAGSHRTIWATRPAPFGAGQVRIALPEGIAAGEYDLKVALLEGRQHLTATHVQRIVVSQGFVYVGKERPLVELIPQPDGGANAAPRLPRARFAMDSSIASRFNVRLAFYREGDASPVAHEDLGHPQAGDVDLRLPKGTPNGLLRLVVALTDAAGNAVASAANTVCCADGRLLVETPPPAPAAKAVLNRTARRRGYTLFSREYTEAFPYNFEPAASDIGRPVEIWAAPGEVEDQTFGVYPLKVLRGARVSVSSLSRSGGGRIDAAQVEVRLARFSPRRVANDAGHFRILPEALVPAGVAELPAGRISQYWLSLRVPAKTAPGDYRGTVRFSATGVAAAELKLLVKVLPFTLVPPRGRTWGLYVDAARWKEYTDAELAREMSSIAARGIDYLAFSPLALGSLRYEEGKLSVDLGPLSRIFAQYRKAGLRSPVVLDLQDLPAEIARARGQERPADDAEARRLYTVVLSALAARATTDGWPDALYCVGEGTRAAAARAAAAKKAGLATCALLAGDKRDGDVAGALNVNWYPAARAFAEPSALEALAGARAPWCFSAGLEEGTFLASRYLAGAAFWRTGAASECFWALPSPAGDAYNDLDAPGRPGGGDPHALFPVPGKHAFYPTIQLEGVREGIDDCRYFATFQQMVAGAKKSRSERVAAYARKVEKEAQALMQRVPWGAAPAGYNAYNAYSLRKWLCKYMGTLVAKMHPELAPPAPKVTARPATHPTPKAALKHEKPSTRHKSEEPRKKHRATSSRSRSSEGARSSRRHSRDEESSSRSRRHRKSDSDHSSSRRKRSSDSGSSSHRRHSDSGSGSKRKHSSDSGSKSKHKSSSSKSKSKSGRSKRHRG